MGEGVMVVDREMHVVSLGAGVQSTTMLLMALHGEIEPRPELAIFADTGWEPRAVYRHLDWLNRLMAERPDGIPIVRVSAGNIRDDALAAARGARARFATMPFFVAGSATREGMLRRQCTQEYKILPIQREIRRRAQGRRVVLWKGISLDEVERLKPSRLRWIDYRYPLVELRMTRHDCLRWLERHGYPQPPRSACIGCPYHTDAEWRRIRDESPEEWQEAVKFDRAIRRLPRVMGEVYLHRSLRPLDEVDLSTQEDRGQVSLWTAECEGMCGV